jgi:bifunctional non-homologous end joining protein LigD
MAVSQKLDGRRLMLVRDYSGVIGISRAGTETSVPDKIIEAFKQVKPEWIFDGEVLGDTYHVFDVVSTPGMNNFHTLRWQDRQDVLKTILQDFDENVKIVQQVYGFLREDYFEMLRQQNAEGVVFANVDGSYRFGVRNNTIGKYKFLKTADCVITDKGVNGSDNLVLALYNEQGELVEVGKVSAITGDGAHHDFSLGEVVEVTFLYVTKDVRLYQPVTPKLRLDKAPEQCMLDQILPYITTKEVVEYDSEQ